MITEIQIRVSFNDFVNLQAGKLKHIYVQTKEYNKAKKYNYDIKAIYSSAEQYLQIEYSEICIFMPTYTLLILKQKR